MSHIQNVLVPVDGSAPSLLALSYALELAGDLRAAVHALSVADASAPYLTPGEQTALDAALADARARLGPRFTQAVVHGETLRTILRTADDQRFDLIVMGTHARVGRLRSLLGSLANDVVRNACCPVLTVREQPGGDESFVDRRHHVPTVAEHTRR